MGIEGANVNQHNQRLNYCQQINFEVSWSHHSTMRLLLERGNIYRDVLDRIFHLQ